MYSNNLITNAFPPFVEPLILLFAVGIGIGKYIEQMNNIPYVEYLASGLLVTTAMFTAAFECSYGTYIRLEYDKAYDGMLGSPITVNDLIIGEVLWAGTKGLFFSAAVLLTVSVFGILPLGSCIYAPVIGFFTGIMFASISLVITSMVKDINQFNFYFTGFISPMFFFSGVIFSIDNLPFFIRRIAELLPLTHSVRIARAVCFPRVDSAGIIDFAYIFVVSIVAGYFAIKRLRKKLIH